MIILPTIDHMKTVLLQLVISLTLSHTGQIILIKVRGATIIPGFFMMPGIISYRSSSTQCSRANQGITGTYIRTASGQQGHGNKHG